MRHRADQIARACQCVPLMAQCWTDLIGGGHRRTDLRLLSCQRRFNRGWRNGGRRPVRFEERHAVGREDAVCDRVEERVVVMLAGTRTNGGERSGGHPQVNGRLARCGIRGGGETRR